MSNIILPEDPDFNQPLKMGDPYDKALTPKLAAQKKIQEFSKNGAGSNYGGSSFVNFGEMSKTAQSIGNTNMITSPMFFSPIHTNQAWQTPAKRREMYMWARFFYQTEPKVAAAIDFYSRFSMNGFELVCQNTKIENWFQHHVVKRLGINEMLKAISSEYFTLGDVFIHMNVDCPQCGGSNKDPDDPEKECGHEGGTFSKIIVLKPDDIEVKYAPFANEPVITMIPDEEWRRIVEKRQPQELYEQIPDDLKGKILSRHPIVLSNRTTTHLKHMPSPYETYGTSLIRRLFTTLAYKTKLMSANWIIAERMILPVRVVKIGSDERPATPIDIIDIQQQLAATANDPNLTIITHNNFDYDFYGASGKILQTTQEMEMIGKEILDGFMLNQALLNGEMSGYQCHDTEQTEVLTKDGFKKYDDISDNDEIGTFNKETEQLEYHRYTDRYDYDFDGEMCHFIGKRMDTFVTPNHRMLVAKSRTSDNDWNVLFANQVTSSHKFRATAKWIGRNAFPKTIKIDEDHQFELEDYIRLVCYFATEGSVRRETRKERSTFGQPSTATIYQSPKGKAYENIISWSSNIPYDVKHYPKYDMFCIHNKVLSIHLVDVCGNHSSHKKIPSWIKELPTQYLQLALNCLIEGDGYCSKKVLGGKQYGFEVKSKQLAEDLFELAFKCGYAPLMAQRKDRGLWCVDFSDSPRGRTPNLTTEKIKRVDYKGRVFCFTVPNGFFVTRRNGKIGIHGNSAQVGVETLIRRIESFRETLADFVENRIFKPIAEMQGFKDEKKSDEMGVPVYIYPKLVFKDLNLKDKTQERNLYIQLHDKGIISTRTLCEKTDIDYDQEVHRKRFEQVAGGPQGGGLGMGAGGGGAPGGDMGGGGGPMMGGGAPGGAAPGGAPGAGGAPAGGMAGTMPSGDMAMGNPGGPTAGSNMKILKKGKHNQKQEDEQQPMQAMPIQLTSLEQEMGVIMEEVGMKLGWNPQQIFNNIRIQYPIQNPSGHKPYTIDFAIPKYKIGAECDGNFWHDQPEQQAEDKERDYKLAKYGWTVLRFDDNTVKENREGVLSTVMSYIQKAMNLQKQKTASANPDGEINHHETAAHLYVMSDSKEMVDIYGQYELYHSILEAKKK